MTRWLLLSHRLGSASRWRLVLLVALMTVAFVVRTVVDELSRISADGLDSAITAESGQEGTYRITLDDDLGLGPQQLHSELEAALERYAPDGIVMTELFPPVQIDCPPLEALGAQSLLVVTGGPTDERKIPYGSGFTGEATICLGGLSIPLDAAYLPNPAEIERWALGVVIRPEYRQVAWLSSTEPISYVFTAVTGDPGIAEVLAQAVTERLTPFAELHGTELEPIFAQRIDAGDQIRRASSGIRLIYRLIGWGVVVLAGLGLLVAELIIVRDRMWFFGLLRALGARRRHIGALVLFDIAGVLVISITLAAIVTLVAEPTASSFTTDAFGTASDLFRASAIPANIAAGMAVLCIAGLAPALRATRHDPLSVLEPSVG